LAGGQTGSYKSPLASFPKPLLPIANRPLVEYTASVLNGVGVTRLIALLDASASDAVTALEALFADGPVRITCLTQPVHRGTAGSLKDAQAYLAGEPFFVVNGCLFLEADLAGMVAAHSALGALATVGAFRAQEPAWDMERIELGEGPQVRAIHRIYPGHNKRSTYRPAGLYLFDPAVLELIPPNRYYDLKEQLFPLLTERGNPARVWEIEGYGWNIMNCADFLAVNRDVLLNRVRIPSPAPSRVHSLTGGPRIASTARLLEPVRVDGTAVIAEGAIVIGPTAIGPHCEVAAGACLDECVVLANARIERGASLHHCIVGEGVRVKEGTVLRDMLVLDQAVEIHDQTVPTGSGASSHTGGLLVLPDLTHRRIYLGIKRVFDVALAAIGLIALAPLLLLLAMAIRLDSAGPAIFRQRRCGQHGHEFNMYKFRTMVPEADQLQRQLVFKNEVDGPMFKIMADPRITRMGRILRGSNVDELPQLWNVLRGEMSLVGPRPLSMDEMRFNPRWRDLRLLVKPGLTGLWQVEAHSKTSFAEWIFHDLYYVRNFSAWLDLKILLKTFLTPLRDYQGAKAAAKEART
jgi:lipopolysaccharide/colanic/teichoic acid biosynthesis glycosyltransferase/NDP-sugar pyrophosphorylase family protein